MKHIKLFEEFNCVNENIFVDAKNKIKEYWKSIFRKIKKMENPIIVTDAGIYSEFFCFGYDESKNHMIFGIKQIIDKINDYIVKRYPNAKQVSLFTNDERYCWELIGVSTEEALEFYQELSDLFKEEAQKEGLTKIQEETLNYGNAFYDLISQETNAECIIERQLDSENDTRDEMLYLYPAVRILYI